ATAFAQAVRMASSEVVFIVSMNMKTKQRLHRLYPELAAGAELPAGPLGKIKLAFAKRFAILLPSPIHCPQQAVVSPKKRLFLLPFPDVEDVPRAGFRGELRGPLLTGSCEADTELVVSDLVDA